jgi:hypothetical protein
VNVATTATLEAVRTLAGLSSQPYKAAYQLFFCQEMGLSEQDHQGSGLMSLAGLLQIKGETVRGPSPSFDRAHVLLSFLTIGAAGTIGRQALARQTGLGQGAIRTVLKKLREEGFADADFSGCHLSRAGLRLYESLTARLSPFVQVTGSQLTVGSSQAALAARGTARKVKSGIEQRDSAIRVRAAGATTYVIRAGKFTIPGGSTDCEMDFPNRAWALLRKELKPKNGDAVILCGAVDETTARIGVLSAALTLL